MKAPALAVLPVAVLLAMPAPDALAEDPPANQDPRAVAPAGMRARLSDDLIRQAVRDTLAEAPSTPAADRGSVLSANGYTSFARKMDEAEVPSCWRPDAMKHQPPRIGPVALGGLLALPFWGAAILRGKCNR